MYNDMSDWVPRATKHVPFIKKIDHHLGQEINSLLWDINIIFWKITIDVGVKQHDEKMECRSTIGIMDGE